MYYLINMTRQAKGNGYIYPEYQKSITSEELRDKKNIRKFDEIIRRQKSLLKKI